MPHAGQQLKAARERQGRTPQELASAAGINLPSYYDLEDIEDELYTALSLGELRALCKALNVRAHELFIEVEDGAPRREVLDFRSLAERVGAYVKDHKLSQAAFEDKAGWELDGFLSDPDVAWSWNVDCLRDICRLLRIDWLSALPS